MKPSEFIAKPRLTLLTSSVLASFAMLSACGGGSSGADTESTLAAVQPSMQIAAADAAASSAESGASAPVAEVQAASVDAVTASSAATSSTAKIQAVAAVNSTSTPSKLVSVPAVLNTSKISTSALQITPTPISAQTVSQTNIFTTSPLLTVPQLPVALNLTTVSQAAPTVQTEAVVAVITHKVSTVPKILTPQLSAASLTAAVTIGSTTACQVGVTISPTLISSTALPLPTDGGATFSSADLSAWRSYVTNIEAGKFTPNSASIPGSVNDWTRIKANANKFLISGDATPANTRLYSGINVRDAAFYFLMTSDAAYLGKLTSYMVKTLEDPANDFVKNICYRSLDPNAPMLDANFGEAAWFMRHVVAYDYIRASIKSADDRRRIENALRRQAHFFAGQIDSGLSLSFPNRLAGDYATVRKGYAAAATTDAEKWMTSRFDTDGNCVIDAKDNKTLLPVYAYLDKSTGKFGPKISILSQWYNNRKSLSVLGWGLAGIVLNDTVLIDHAKRYFMEWLTYAVYPDGSEGEYARNGDYCIAKQGVIYGFTNVQAALNIGSWLKKSGDSTLINFQTIDGLYGTESTSPAAPKSISKVVDTYSQLAAGALPWYAAEPWKTIQQPVAKTYMGALEVRFNNGGPTDDYHELGMLLSIEALPADKKAYARSVIMRIGAPSTTPRFPGSTGNPVATGLNNGWTDASNALPAIFLLDRGLAKR